MRETIKILQEMEFSEYEAKAYLALLENSPLTGYGVALNSGVPRSKVYEVLGNMAMRGDVIVSQDEKPLYAPIPPNELIESRKAKTSQILEDAEKALRRFTVTAENRESIWNITGRSAIIARVCETMSRAKRRILFEAWEEDVLDFRDCLKAAADRGIAVFIMVYGSKEFDYGQFGFAHISRHDMSDEVAVEHGGRWVLFSKDDEEIVAGIISIGAESRAAWTTHPGLAIPITEFIIHDLYMMEMVKACGPELEKYFGPNLIELRKKFGIKAWKDGMLQ